MKVLLLNGSPNQHGCTHTALCEVARAIEESGIETEILWIGNQAVRGCIGCGAERGPYLTNPKEIKRYHKTLVE